MIKLLELYKFVSNVKCMLFFFEGRNQRNKKINFGGCIEMNQANKIENLLKKYETQ